MTPNVGDAPDTLTLRHNRDLEGFYRGAIWVRRGVVAILTLISVLGLVNVFGQKPSTTLVSSSVAALKSQAPTKVRGGDLWQARFHITAKKDISNANLVLDPGWADGMTINTIEPSPANETSDNGRLGLQLGPIKAGQDFILFMAFQTNPTTVTWQRPQNVELLDGDQRLTSIDRTITVFP
jgi:hypothetical protein